MINYCPKCGNKVNDKNANFCCYCREPISEKGRQQIKDEIKERLNKHVEIEIKKRKIENLKSEFSDILLKVNTQTTSEILEVLMELDQLEIIYNKIKALDITSANQLKYQTLKEEIVNNLITDKFRKNIGSKKKSKEKLKSLYDELKVCESRYPQYKDIFERHIEIIQNNLNN